jgi:hypothetical protein
MRGEDIMMPGRNDVSRGDIYKTLEPYVGRHWETEEEDPTLDLASVDKSSTNAYLATQPLEFSEGVTVRWLYATKSIVLFIFFPDPKHPRLPSNSMGFLDCVAGRLMEQHICPSQVARHPTPTPDAWLVMDRVLFLGPMGQHLLQVKELRMLEY